MEKYIPKVGDKVFGFDFKQTKYKANYVGDMDSYVGKLGVVSIVHEDTFFIKFDDNYWWYPVELAHLALMKEEDNPFKFGDRVKFTESSLESGMIDARKDDVFTVHTVYSQTITLRELQGYYHVAHIEHVKEEIMDNTDSEIDWQVGQEVYCILHGKGVVQDVLPYNYSYPVKVDCVGKIYSYSKNGKFHKDHKGRVLFFSDPEIIAEKFPPKKPFTPVLKRGDTIFVVDKYGTFKGGKIVRCHVELEDRIVTSEEGHYLLKKDLETIHLLGDEVKFS